MNNTLVSHQKLMSYLLISIPLLLITGPFLSDLAVVLICALYLFNNFKKEMESILKSYFFKIFFCFYIICIVSSLFSEYPLNSTMKSVAYIRFLVFIFAVNYILNLDTKFAKKFFISIFICLLIIVFDGIYQFIFKKNIFGFVMYEARVSSFFKDELIYGSFISKLLPLFLGLYFLIKNKNYVLKISFSIMLLLSIFAITISGERSALLLTILFLFYLLFMLKLNLKILLSFLLIVSLGVSSLLLLNKSLNDRVINFTKQQVIKDEKIILFSSDHQGHFLAAMDIFNNNNKFIGIGPKNFRNYCYNEKKYSKAPYVCSSHPHNTYVQLLVENGILGFLFPIFIFLAISYYSAKHLFLKIFKNQIIFDNFQVCLLSYFLMIMWPIIPTGSFFNNYLSIMYYLPLGFFIWSLSAKKNLG